MDLPVAPPAFDAASGPRRHDRADTGADIGAGCGPVFLELTVLVADFGLWFLSWVTLDTARTVRADSPWGCLTGAAAVAAFALVAALVAARARAIVTVVSQMVMAVLITLVVPAAALGQAHEDGSAGNGALLPRRTGRVALRLKRAALRLVSRSP
ncbi:DUF6234 family protein [Streptomyces roseochromogenus]|uniref:DUF6234 domain-containing protein n=1 Tax=Streptomyces roseochromogenus subsp. oscitans DS 12.976 TaxID=1352936 RepID=V6JK57_STRRC|nr:DUF6234 family protein [Streptomyces roseochromogenus]EST19521.1 hypothetical protein M878_42000 [Streptomyces roseochromogenus subsp. oscitans DS 12.976]